MNRLKTFYDGGCPMCSREIEHYRSIDRAQRIDWIDITSDDAALAEAGLDRETAMRRLHVREPDGRLLSGVAAFTAIWQRLPRWRGLARLIIALRLTKPLDWVYARFADWRFSRRCAEGACGID